ncbi:MAG: hypothetical protein WDM96_13610 [Lacunisphaera sp.]
MPGIVSTRDRFGLLGEVEFAEITAGALERGEVGGCEGLLCGGEFRRAGAQGSELDEIEFLSVTNEALNRRRYARVG